MSISTNNNKKNDTKGLEPSSDKRKYIYTRKIKKEIKKTNLMIILLLEILCFSLVFDIKIYPETSFLI